MHHDGGRHSSAGAAGRIGGRGPDSPRRIRVRRGLYEREPNFSFTVTPAKAAPNLSPVTVRARGSTRARAPRGRPASFELPLRDFELSDWVEQTGMPPVGQSRRCELLCSGTNRFDFRKRVVVWADAVGGSGVEVTVAPPVGLRDIVGGEFRFTPTPFGVDVRVLQSGRRVARLRIAGRCDLEGKGQATSCRFKRIRMTR